MLVVLPGGNRPGWRSGEGQARRSVRYVRKDCWQADFQGGDGGRCRFRMRNAHPLERGRCDAAARSATAALHFQLRGKARRRIRRRLESFVQGLRCADGVVKPEFLTGIRGVDVRGVLNDLIRLAGSVVSRPASAHGHRCQALQGDGSSDEPDEKEAYHTRHTRNFTLVR